MNRRDIEQLISDHGLRLVSMVRNKHWKARVVTPHGTVASVTFPNSESDHRALKNKTAQLRKIAQGVG